MVIVIMVSEPILSWGVRILQQPVPKVSIAGQSQATTTPGFSWHQHVYQSTTIRRLAECLYHHLSDSNLAPICSPGSVLSVNLLEAILHAPVVLLQALQASNAPFPRQSCWGWLADRTSLY